MTWLPGRSPGETAARYADLGWRVIPIGPGNKHPSVKEWQKEATTSPTMIDKWWGTDTGKGTHRDHGVGVATGAGSGIWVLDIDVADNKPGWRNFSHLLAAHPGDFPKTVCAQTGTGGFHYFFRWDPERPVHNGMATRLPEGIDIRGEGGQVVAAPTVHPNGNQYMWIVAPYATDTNPATRVADAPDWLYDLILADPEPPAPAISIPVRVFDGPPKATAPTDSPADHIRINETWSALLAGHGWTHSHDRGGDTYWTRPGKDRRLGHSAVTHGDDGAMVIWSSETHPDLWRLGTPTSDQSGVSISKFDFIAAMDHGGDRKAAARAVRDTMPPPAKPQLTHTPEERHEIATGFMAQFVTGGEALELPPPEPMVGTWIDQGAVVVMPGPFGSGKTHLLMALALSVGSGEPWLDQPVHGEPGNVWYFVGEGVYTIGDRLRAWKLQTGRSEIPGTVKWHPHAFSLDRSESWADMRYALEDLDDADRPRLIIFDTWSKYISGAEVPDVTKPALETVDHIRNATGATIVLATHTGHNVTGRSRGDSTLEDNADIVIPLMGRLRDDNGVMQVVQMVNTKQKARATQLPMNLKLRSVQDPSPPEFEPQKTLAWVEATEEDLSADEKDDIAIQKAKLKMLAQARRSRAPATKTEWADSIGVRRTSAHAAFEQLRQAGFFVEEVTTGRGQTYVPDRSHPMYDK